MAGEVIGYDCKLFYNSATNASPTWVEITNAVDVSMNIDKNYGNVSSRASGWKKNKAALKDLSISFGYRYKQGVTDAVFDVLRAAAIANTQLQLWVADGASATTGTEGISAYYDLTMGQEQPLEDGVMIPFEGKHVVFYESGSMVEPTWKQVS